MENYQKKLLDQRDLERAQAEEMKNMQQEVIVQEISDDKSTPIKKKKKKPQITTNVQTEDDFNEIIGDHPLEMINQTSGNYSPKPFDEVRSSPELESEHGTGRQSPVVF